MPRELSPKVRAAKINDALGKAYPDAAVELHFSNAFELLIATILSAQTTDRGVNEVTPVLFEKYPDAKALAKADPADVETIVKPTGFFRQKTKSIIATSQDIAERFGGKVPDNMDDLVSLRGVGRKTSNVVLGSVFGKPAIIVDTHFRRVTGRLGLTDNTDPDKIELDIQRLLPESEWTAFSHRITIHGRRCCFARKPNCAGCPVNKLCPSAFKV